MSQTTARPKSDILGTLETALDNNSEYIGEKVWKELDKAYESMDSDVVELVEELDNAKRRIAELEEHIHKALTHINDGDYRAAETELNKVMEG